MTVRPRSPEELADVQDLFGRVADLERLVRRLLTPREVEQNAPTIEQVVLGVNYLATASFATILSVGDVAVPSGSVVFVLGCCLIQQSNNEFGEFRLRTVDGEGNITTHTPLGLLGSANDGSTVSHFANVTQVWPVPVPAPLITIELQAREQGASAGVAIFFAGYTTLTVLVVPPAVVPALATLE